MKKLLWLVCFICVFNNHLCAEKPSLHVCTVANYQAPGLINLINSGKAFGIDVKVIGMNQSYPNHFTKIRKMRQSLDHLPSSDVVLFVDAFDVLLLASKENILNKFLERKIPCIFSAERRYYPKNSGSDLDIPYPSSKTSFRYLNSGSYIGYVGYIKMMLDEIIDNQYSIPFTRYRRLNDDQYHCHRYFLQNQETIRLDKKTELFLPLADIEKEELVINSENRTVYVKETKNFPLIIHGNGPGKEMYQEIAKLFFD